jgi:hypothetical protein
MAATTTKEVIFQGHRKYAIKVQCTDDGSGLTGYSVVDISTLTGFTGMPITYTALEEAEWDVQGYNYIQLYWDHTTPAPMMTMGAGNGNVSYEHIGYLFDPKTAGGTGDILVSTNGAIAGASFDFTIVIQLRE